MHHQTRLWEVGGAVGEWTSAIARAPCPAPTRADPLLRQGNALSKVRIIRVLVPSAALVTVCAVVAGFLTSSSPQPLTVAAAPTPTASTSISLPKATPRPRPKAVVRHTAIRHYTYVPVSYQQPVYAAARQGAHTALIIGINDTDPKNPLLGAGADAANMRTALLKYGFHSSDIVVLRDGQATRPRLLSALRRPVSRT